jgi:tRNA(Arg) A34 adenosine deaminase TadA
MPVERHAQSRIVGAMSDEELLRRAFELACIARAKGNHPFGAVLGNPDGTIGLEAENTVVTEGDCTAHAELSVLRAAFGALDLDLSRHTLFASTEPCPMCAGAAYWSGIGRIVYGLSARRLNAMTSPGHPSGINLPCRDLLARGARRVVVVGPLLEDEAAEAHCGFWR